MNFYILLSSNVFFIWIYIKNIPNIHFPLQIWVEQQRQNQEVMNSSHIDSWTLVIVSKLILNAFYSLSLSHHYVCIFLLPLVAAPPSSFSHFAGTHLLFSLNGQMMTFFFFKKIVATTSPFFYYFFFLNWSCSRAANIKFNPHPSVL